MKQTLLSGTVLLILIGISIADINAQTNTNPSVRDTVYLVVFAPGPAWLEGKPVEEQNLGEHGRNLIRLYNEGIMLQAGPFTNNTGGAIIYRAKNLAAAKKLVESDPAVISGKMIAKVFPWKRVKWDYYLDKAALSKLNAQFIENFINENVTAHEKIIHPDFICIKGDGTITNREEYLKNWATAYSESGYTSFSIMDEVIRIFGDMALVWSKTVYTKKVDGKTIHGNSLYTDTYIKENGEWLCVQAQITPISTK